MKRKKLCFNFQTLSVGSLNHSTPISQVSSFSKPASLSKLDASIQIHFLFHLDYCNNLLTGSNLAAFPSLCCQSGSCRHFWSELSCFKPFRTNIGVIKGECTRIRSVALFITQDRLGRKGGKVNPWGIWLNKSCYSHIQNVMQQVTMIAGFICIDNNKDELDILLLKKFQNLKCIFSS